VEAHSRVSKLEMKIHEQPVENNAGQGMSPRKEVPPKEVPRTEVLQEVLQDVLELDVLEGVESVLQDVLGVESVLSGVSWQAVDRVHRFQACDRVHRFQA